MDKTNFGLYVIVTKPILSHRAIAEQCVANGIKMLQLREKHMPDRELLRIARELRSITAGTCTRLVINDRPDIATLCKADYLHLGQDDITIDDARKIVGDMEIGLSTHSIAQVEAAMSKKPAYIGFGPIFPTNAKAIPDTPVGTNLLQQAIGLSNVPVVAIGGIFPENVHKVISASAQNVSLVRYLMQAGNPYELQQRLNSLQQLLNN